MKERRRHERGEYRPIFVAWLNGKDFRELDAPARWILLNVKLLMGPLGIGPHPGADRLAETSGLKRPAVLKALGALAAAGWIEEGDGLLWLVRGLEFEPQFAAKNDNHRPFIAAKLKEFPSAPIVDRFRERYAQYLTIPTEGDGAGQGVGHPPSHTPRQGGSEPAASSQQPPTSTTDLNTAAPSGARDYATIVTVTANGALSEKLAGAYKPLRAEVEAPIADAWARDGIPLELARRVVAERIASFRVKPHDRQPNTLRYFDNAVREAFARDQAKVLPIKPAAQLLPRITA